MIITGNLRFNRNKLRKKMVFVYKGILSPIKIGNLELKNRIVFAPTSMGLNMEEYFSRIRELAKGGVSLIIIGDIPVKESVLKSLYTEEGFKFFSKVCSIAHEYDSKVSAQLYLDEMSVNVIRESAMDYFNKTKSLSAMMNFMFPMIKECLKDLPIGEIEDMIKSFVKAAKLAKKAGFDMIQILGDRLCGSFSSSIYNIREDEYGGTTEKRAAFSVEVVREVVKSVGDMPIDFKLPVREENPHYGNGGFLMEELKTVIPMLEKAGVNSFHVSLANHSALKNTIPPHNHEYFKEEGCFLKYCDEVRKYTKLPVCGVGALINPDFIEEQLISGRIDLAAMSRELIADPQWVNKVKSGQIKDIKKCIRCNKGCVGGLIERKGVHCIIST